MSIVENQQMFSGCGLMCSNSDNEAPVAIKGVNISILLFS